MTALNVIQTRDAIHFFSDGAFIDPRNGNVVSTGPKARAFPAARCAMSVSGPQAWLEQLFLAGEEGLSIDQVLHDVQLLLPRLVEILALERRAFEIFIGGFAEGGERQLWKISGFTDGREFSAIRCDPDSWHYSPPLTPHLISSVLGDESLAAFNRGFAERLDCKDTETHGLIALEAQRRIKVSDHVLAAGSAYTVGIFAQQTTVYLDKIETRILKRWPDPCGLPISPEGAAKVYSSGFGNITFVPAQAVGFKSADGINAGSSSNYSVDTTSGLVKPTSTAGSMISAATGTLITDCTTRTSAIFDGVTNQASSGAAQKASTNSFYAGKTYSGGKAVGKAVVYGTNNLGFVGSSNPSITINLRGKNGTAPSSASDGDLIGTLTFTDTLNESTGRTVTSTDTSTVYDHVFVQVSQSGSADTMCVAEVQFYEPGTTAAMTVVTTAQTVDASVDHGRVLIEYNPVDAIALNTDLTVEVTCDGGSNWQSGTLSLKTAYGQGGRSIAETDDVTCVSGTSYAARIKTANNKTVEVYGLSIAVH